MKSDCQQCGSCCKGFLIVEADYVDVLRCPLILERYADESQPTLAELEADEDSKCILLTCGLEHPCQFLDDNKCAIYLMRPNTCVYMQAGSIQCANSRKMHGLKPVRARKKTDQMTFEEVLA